MSFSAVIYECINDEVSKACYGPPGIPCTYHNLRCSSGRIAIQEAFYTDSTACGLGVSSCIDISLNSIPLTGTRYNFSDTELDLLYGNCSTQSTCSLQSDKRVTFTFSAIIYECIGATTTLKTSLTTRRRGTTPTLTSSTPSTSSSIVPQDQTTTTDIGWMFAGGIFTGLAIAAVINSILYIFYIRRRCVIKKPDPGPASPNHPTYTGLTDLGRPETYDVIHRPEAETRPSETSQTPVYQNVDDAS